MLWITILVAFAIAAAALVYVIAPLRKPATPLPSEDDDHLADLLARKETVLLAIKETEFDYHTGKLSEEDYQRYEHRLRRQAIGLIQQIEKIAPESDSLNTQLEQEIARMRKVRTNGAAPQPTHAPPASAASPATSPAPAAAPVRFCHECGAAVSEGDKFCSQCGTLVRQATAVV